MTALTATMAHALRVSHLMLRLVHQDLEVLVPLGVQIVVDDLALRHVLLPHSHSARAHISTSDVHIGILPRMRHARIIRVCTSPDPVPFSHGRIWKGDVYTRLLA